MERPEWQNLNGLWQYAIVDKNISLPAEYQGEILVPFCVESALSGVGKEVGADKALWYKRNFKVPKSWHGRDIMLNFGAVDWQAEIWINGAKVGSHTGGYSPFSLNITQALNAKATMRLLCGCGILLTRATSRAGNSTPVHTRSGIHLSPAFGRQSGLNR